MSDVLGVIFGFLVIFGPAIVILTARDNHRRKKLAKAGLLITNKTILSGTPPHRMGGELSDRLRGYAKLPDPEWEEATTVPSGLIEQAIEAAKALNNFSVLCVERTEGTATRTKKDGIDMSWRMDGVRPSQMHVSQSAWNPERRLYELDEWISVEHATYMNPGFWFKLENPAAARDYAQLGKELKPEAALHRLMNQDVACAGILNDETASYFCIETTGKEESGSTSRMQAWIEQGSHLIRKFRMAVYENDALAGERIYAFADAPSDRSIQTPDWVEEDTAIPRIIEHW